MVKISIWVSHDNIHKKEDRTSLPLRQDQICNYVLTDSTKFRAFRAIVHAKIPQTSRSSCCKKLILFQQQYFCNQDVRPRLLKTVAPSSFSGMERNIGMA